MFVGGVEVVAASKTFSDKLSLLKAPLPITSAPFSILNVLPTSAAQEVVRTLFVVQKVGSCGKLGRGMDQQIELHTHFTTLFTFWDFIFVPFRASSRND
jgi:hypothetical protein